MRIVLGLLLPLCIFAQSYGLRTLVENANKENGLITAKEIRIKAKQEEVEAAKSAYWPTIDVGASHSYVSPTNIVNPGQTSSAFATVNLEIYDGGRKSALLDAKRYEHEAALFEKRAFEKSITLEIVRHYYGLQKLRATLQALKERSIELQAQIKRIKKFKSAGLSTQEEVDKLQAEYDSNNYTMANTKLELLRSERNLELLSGLPVTGLKKNTFKEPENVEFEIFENIKMLQANANAVGENSQAINAGYGPQINISDTYNRSRFDDTVSMGDLSGDGLLLDHQNKVMISVNMRLFDKGKIAKESEAVKYQKMALLSEIDYAKNEQMMNYNLSQKSLETIRTRLKSAQSALRAANSTYAVLKNKFEVGLIDNIAFLDALTEKTVAQSRYKETLYDYEIGKSIYYYYAGKDPKEFIR
ncbi:TolC family protein [Sulfurovum sp. XGS-02]|uniref:TolC family protein n=1 Tax=Sulfurovum sp. XGS-02 TaxID=2925411 RepID=UPI00205AC763|nr:TolC family protein [Sulfurovum sp. XGS-02]UPT76780.1 TolC family protein [Sulfurovum sp. XGS-02]